MRASGVGYSTVWHTFGLARRTMRLSAYIDFDEDGAGLRSDPVELAELRETMRAHAREHASPQPT